MSPGGGDSSRAEVAYRRLARIGGISNVISENGEQLWAKFGTE